MNFFQKLIDSESSSSSKRFVALLLTALCVYVVIRYVNHSNMMDYLTITYWFIGALLGIGTALAGLKYYQKKKTQRSIFPPGIPPEEKDRDKEND